MGGPLGFMFCGRHCREFGISMRSSNRTVLPTRNARQVSIPGRDGRYNFPASTYDVRVIELECMVSRQDFPAFRESIRDVAHWLSGVGDLVFVFFRRCGCLWGGGGLVWGGWGCGGGGGSSK
jgi:phage-related protein